MRGCLVIAIIALTGTLVLVAGFASNLAGLAPHSGARSTIALPTGSPGVLAKPARISPGTKADELTDELGQSQIESDVPIKDEWEGVDSPWRPRSHSLPFREDFVQWENDPLFKHDVFTFVRIQYDSNGPMGWWDRWDNDYPDGDWNFSYRLQELTSIKTDPNGKVLRFTDPRLFDYPFAYMAGVHYMSLSAAESKAFGEYLTGGGFVMMDDFWTEQAWSNVKRQMAKVLPGSEPVELSIDHPIFQIVYPLKKLPQVVDYKTWQHGYSYEPLHGQMQRDRKPHFWAYFDDNNRMVAICCQNNDVGDGWEREGKHKEYFKKYSEKQSYPLGINIVTYAMTH